MSPVPPVRALVDGPPLLGSCQRDLRRPVLLVGRGRGLGENREARGERHAHHHDGPLDTPQSPKRRIARGSREERGGLFVHRRRIDPGPQFTANCR
jgi:hypothetical protein